MMIIEREALNESSSKQELHEEEKEKEEIIKRKIIDDYYLSRHLSKQQHQKEIRSIHSAAIMPENTAESNEENRKANEWIEYEKSKEYDKRSTLESTDESTGKPKAKRFSIINYIKSTDSNSRSSHSSSSILNTSSLKHLFRKGRYLRCSFYRNNASFFLFILIYIIIQIILVAVQLSLYSSANGYVKLARVNGILISFNSSFTIFLVLRRVLTWIRNSNLGRRLLPLDDFIAFHKLIGVLLLVYSIIHTIAHCVNLYYLSDEYRDSYVSSHKIVTRDIHDFYTDNNLYNNRPPHHNTFYHRAQQQQQQQRSLLDEALGDTYASFMNDNYKMKNNKNNQRSSNGSLKSSLFIDILIESATNHKSQPEQNSARSQMETLNSTPLFVRDLADLSSTTTATTNRATTTETTAASPATTATTTVTTTLTTSIIKSLNESVPMSLGKYGELLFTTKSKIGWVGGTAMPTGWALLVILLVLEFFSLPCIRRRGYFEVDI